MNYLRVFSTCLLALLLHSAAWAEIYETTDAEGNVEFTDSPPDEGSEVVDLQQTNIADAPQPAAQEQSAPESQTDTQPNVHQPQIGSNIEVVDDADPRAYDEYEAKERAYERANPSAPHEVLEAEAPNEVGDFNQEAPAEGEDNPVIYGDADNPDDPRVIRHRNHHRE